MLLPTLGFAACHNSSKQNHDSPPAKTRSKKSQNAAPASDSEKNAPRLLRRLALDILGQLPDPTDRAAVASDNSQLVELRRNYTLSTQAALSLAENLRWAWGIRANRLPDLDLMIAQGDAGLGATMTRAMRQAIVDETTQLTRYILSRQLPFSALFSAEYSVAQADVLTLWGMSQVSQPWVGENIYFGQFSDSRPASGLLTTHGFLAGIASEQRSDVRARTWSMLRRLTCLDHDNNQAHRFDDLSAEIISGDLLSYANNNAPCASCHRHAATVAPAFNGLASAETFASWLLYSPNNSPETGYYAGHEFTGLAELGLMIGTDPRVARCGIMRTYEATLQRPFNDGRRATSPNASDAADNKNFYDAMNAYLGSNKQIATGWNRTFAAQQYSSGLSDETTVAAPKATTFETRFLTRHHWSSIATQLIGGDELLSLTDDLDPGSADEVAPEYRVTNGAYWHATNRVARQFASALVDKELADSVEASTRVVLSSLPNGAGNSASTDEVRTQIIKVWELFTSYNLATDDPQIERLYQLWLAASEGGSSAAQHRNGWRTLLVGILLSDQFLTY